MAPALSVTASPRVHPQPVRKRTARLAAAGLTRIQPVVLRALAEDQSAPAAYESAKRALAAIPSAKLEASAIRSPNERAGVPSDHAIFVGCDDQDAAIAIWDANLGRISRVPVVVQSDPECAQATARFLANRG